MTRVVETVMVAARFRGPPNSGNGGYVGGLLAGLFPDPDPGPGAVEATLRAPIPLDRPLAVARGADPGAPGAIRLLDGQTLIAEARRVPRDPEAPPAPPDFAAAEAARAASPSFLRHVNPLLPDGTGFHPVCVCCGVDVPAGEGLFVHAAPVPGFQGVAAAWRPDPRLAAPDGSLPEPLVWTALDCPGQFALYAAGVRTGLLGRMTVRVLAPVPVDGAYVVTGRILGVERRKHFAGTALHDGQGRLLAESRQVWIGGAPV